MSGDRPQAIVLLGGGRAVLTPCSRQRRRLESVLGGLEEASWLLPSRCSGWTVKDVVAHLDGVNRFWAASVRAGLAGTPTRLLRHFDPVATPEQLVAPTRELPPRAVLERYRASTDELLGILEDLDADCWDVLAETPPGDLPVSHLAHHALWDAWVHERDVLLPLGECPQVVPDEVEASLRYVAALAVTAARRTGGSIAPSLELEADDLGVVLQVEVGASVVVRDGTTSTGAPGLRGSGVALVEAISMRTELDGVPDAWAQVLEGFRSIFAPAPDGALGGAGR